jgi:transglutaminase-like putative cysteine protease
MSISKSKKKSGSRTQPWRDTAIPRRPLLWLAAALLFTLPPMFGQLAGWAPSFFLLALALKFWMEPRGYRLRSFVLKLILAAVTVGTIFLSYGTLKGVEPAVSLLTILVSLKILEAHTAREFQVMVMMAWVLCLCGFLLSQDFAIAFSLFIAFALLISSLVQFYRGQSPGAFWLPLATTFKLLAQAAPVVVLLFLLFPRINTGFQFRIGDLHAAMTGFSDRLSPGGIAVLANSTNVAFRAEFPDRRTGPPGPMYWRGLVMWHCEGMEWRAPYGPASISDLSRPLPASDKAIRQRITIAPHGARWMFALDRPFGKPSGAMLARGNYLYSFQPIRKTRRYEVLSSTEPIGKELDAYERREALQLPASISPAVRELAASFAAHDSEPRATVARALQFFRTQGFRYSLSPGEYNKNDLEEFLFHRRTGFCEHYAASFATLMRLAGIPARVVVGYLGGEYNDLGGFFLVHQADTHAWCEVWIPESGWTRIDPTTAVAPDRASQDLSSFLADRVASGEMAAGRTSFVTQLARLALVNQIKSLWEALNYQWDTRILGFDADVQDVLLTSLGLTNGGPLPLVMQVSIVIAGLLITYAGWMQLRTRPRADRIQALYERFCQKLARIGVQRDPWEGPSDFSKRAAQSLPNESERVRQITGTYIALRYAPGPARANLHEFAKEVSAFTAQRQ